MIYPIHNFVAEVMQLSQEEINERILFTLSMIGSMTALYHRPETKMEAKILLMDNIKNDQWELQVLKAYLNKNETSINIYKTKREDVENSPIKFIKT